MEALKTVLAVILVVIVVAVAGFGIYKIGSFIVMGIGSWVQSENDKQTFYDTHCKVTATSDGNSGYGFVGGKYVYISNSGTKTYTCDDGTTHTVDN